MKNLENRNQAHGHATEPGVIREKQHDPLVSWTLALLFVTISIGSLIEINRAINESKEVKILMQWLCPIAELFVLGIFILMLIIAITRPGSDCE